MALVCLCRGNFYWPPHTTILFCSIFLDKIVLDTLKSRYHRSAPLGMTNKEDKADLLKVYSDEKSVPFFNSDNCGGDDFYYTTEKRMEQAIEFWHWEYDRQGFVRWTIVSKETNEAVGTIELFHREAEDYFTNCGLLRLDIRSDYEITSEIVKILELIIEPAYVLFQCDKIATKAIDLAVERISALKRLGFKYSEEKLIGHDGTEYDSYYVLEQ